MGSYFVGEVGDYCRLLQEVLEGQVGLGVRIASAYPALKTGTEIEEILFF